MRGHGQIYGFEKLSYISCKQFWALRQPSLNIFCTVPQVQSWKRRQTNSLGLYVPISNIVSTLNLFPGLCKMTGLKNLALLFLFPSLSLAARCLSNPCLEVPGVGLLKGSVRQSSFTERDFYAYQAIPYGESTGGDRRSVLVIQVRNFFAITKCLCFIGLQSNSGWFYNVD